MGGQRDAMPVMAGGSLGDWWDWMLYSPSGPVVALAVMVVLLVLTGVLLGSGGHGSNQPTFPVSDEAAASFPTSTESSETETTTQAQEASQPVVGASSVETVLDEYQQDYSAEDTEALKGLFAEDLTRQNANDAPEDLSEALATYKKQFAELGEGANYSLSEESVNPMSQEASASARYSITGRSGTVNGSIEFHLTEDEGRLLIDKITIQPSQ